MSETTPLLPTKAKEAPHNERFPPVSRVILMAFLLAMSFSSTQTSLMYLMRVTTCQQYTGRRQVGHDVCDVPAVDSQTAQHLAIMSIFILISTTLNLFVTQCWISKFGIKAAMFQQGFWACWRVLSQIYAQYVGFQFGSRVLQFTQLFNILGSAGGYSLAANSFLVAFVPKEERTGMFGVLSGMQMAGQAAGGAAIYAFLGLYGPFAVSFFLFVVVTVSGALFLPYVAPPTTLSDTPIQKHQRSFLGPLSIFVPKRVEGRNAIRRDYRLTLLAIGTYTSVLATGYVPTALQLVGTNVFGFEPSKSGVMLSLTLIIRSLFLTIAFPRIIASGRACMGRTDRAHAVNAPKPATLPDAECDAETGELTGGEVIQPTDESHGALFDLHFLRYSILVDAILTTSVQLVKAGWQMFVAAAILPFASGTAPAVKGVILDMVDPEHRASALPAIALVENLAQVSTVGVFGLVFSALSARGHPVLVFGVNGAVALSSFLILLCVRKRNRKSGESESIETRL